MQFLKKNFNILIYSIVLLVVGILCIIADVASDANDRVNAFTGISLTIGIVFIIIASLALILAIIGSVLAKKSALIAAVGSASILGAGIFFVIKNTVAGELIVTFISLIPYLLLCVGALIVLHGIFEIIFGAVNKNMTAGLVTGIVSILIGGVTMLLGFLTIGDDPVIEKQLMIFGIILALMAVLGVVSCFTTKTAVLVFEKTEEKKAEEEKPEEEKTEEPKAQDEKPAEE